MRAVQRDHWYFVVLVFLPFLRVEAFGGAVTVRLEEGMVLKCLCPWKGNFSMVSWTKIPNRDPIAVFHPEYGVAFSYHYRERIEFLRTASMDGSISVRNVTHQDIGLYQCSVQTFPQGSWTRNIQVEDLDKPPEEDDSAEPPTPKGIEANTELQAEQGDNLTIACDRRHHATVYRATLERRLHGQDWGVIGVCKKVGGLVEVGLVSEEYSDRGRLSCTDTLDVSLRLTGVVQQDGGLYRCTFSTEAGVQASTVLLSVSPTGGFSLSAYMMYIYTGAGAATCILFIFIFVLALKHRKQNKREEYRVQLHPSQRPPNVYENIPECCGKKPRQIRNCPVYVNLQTVRSPKTLTSS